MHEYFRACKGIHIHLMHEFHKNTQINALMFYLVRLNIQMKIYLYKDYI